MFQTLSMQTMQATKECFCNISYVLKLQQLCPNKFTQPSHQNPTSHSYRIYHACKVEDFCILKPSATQTYASYIFISKLQNSDPKHSALLKSFTKSQNLKLSNKMYHFNIQTGKNNKRKTCKFLENFLQTSGKLRRKHILQQNFSKLWSFDNRE